jgi:adenylate cyclase class 2
MVKDMPIEIEAKAYAKNLGSMEDKIKGMGAKLAWQGEQKDTYYNHPSRDFATTDEALRVREEEGTIILTYKGPKIDKLTKTREEIKVQVENMASIKEILMKLGFKEVGMVKKHRKKYILGKFKICLDDVDKLGEFAEVEALLYPEKSNDEVRTQRDDILKVFDELGLKEMERRSYLELLLAKSQ